MCKYGHNTLVRVRIPKDLACEGRAIWKDVQIDTCIAPLVRALQKGGIHMRGSCCGHGSGPGTIDLEDGRTLVVMNAEDVARALSGAQAASPTPA